MESLHPFVGTLVKMALIAILIDISSWNLVGERWWSYLLLSAERRWYQMLGIVINTRDEVVDVPLELEGDRWMLWGHEIGGAVVLVGR